MNNPSFARIIDNGAVLAAKDALALTDEQVAALLTAAEVL